MHIKQCVSVRGTGGVTSNAAFQISSLSMTANLQPHPSTLQDQSCNQTLKTFPELKISLPPTSTSNFLQLQPNMPGPSTGPSRGGLRGPLVEGQHVPAVRGSPRGGGGTKHEHCDQCRPHYSHGKRPTALNLLIKFRTSGHGGLDSARHSGVSSVSHDCHTHQATPTVAGQSDSAERPRAAGQ